LFALLLRLILLFAALLLLLVGASIVSGSISLDFLLRSSSFLGGFGGVCSFTLRSLLVCGHYFLLTTSFSCCLCRHSQFLLIRSIDRDLESFTFLASRLLLCWGLLSTLPLSNLSFFLGCCRFLGGFSGVCGLALRSLLLLSHWLLLLIYFSSASN